MLPVANNMSRNLFGHGHRAPAYNQYPVRISGNELLD
jgi:hypothetical protein